MLDEPSSSAQYAANSSTSDNRLAAPGNDSPILGWRRSNDEVRHSMGSVPGGYPYGNADEEYEAHYSGRNSSDSDLYNFYSEDHHHAPASAHARSPSSASNALDMPALSALSDILLNASQNTHEFGTPESQLKPFPTVEPYEREYLPDSSSHLGIPAEDREHDSSSSDKEVADLDPTMRFSSASGRASDPIKTGTGHSRDAFPGSNSTSPLSKATHQNLAARSMRDKTAWGGVDAARLALQGTAGMEASNPSTASTDTTSNAYGGLSRPPSIATTPSSVSPPQSNHGHVTSLSRANSNIKPSSPYSSILQSQSPTPRQSQAGPISSPANSPSSSYPQHAAAPSSPTSLPYSQPIPRPHRARNDAIHQLHRGSSISGHSGSSSNPPSAHFPRNSGSPPIPSAQGRPPSGTRRQSALRSSIVSGDLEWEKGGLDADQGQGSVSSREVSRVDADRPLDDESGEAATLEYGSEAQHGYSVYSQGANELGPQYIHDETAIATVANALRSISPGPSSSSYQSAARPGSSFQASRPPSSYQDSGRGSGYGFQDASYLHSPPTADTSAAHSAASSPEVGKRAPSLHSRPSRSNLQSAATASSGLMRSPSNGGLSLSRSPSNGSMITGGRSIPQGGRTSPGRALSRTTSGSMLNSSHRSASGTNLSALGRGPSPGLSRSNSYSSKSIVMAQGSPEPPVPPLPPSARSIIENPDVPVGMATTTDEPVHLGGGRVNRSRANSVNRQLGDESFHPFNASISSLEAIGAGRTSWGGHPPPPLNSQRSSEWGPVPEDDGEMTEGSTDLEAEADVDDDEADHTYNSSQSRQQTSSTLPGSTVVTSSAGDTRPTTRYSAGSSIADEWETDGSGNKYLRRPPKVFGETDVSEVSDSDFDDVGGLKRRPPVEEERTAAIVLAEEGGGLIVNLAGMSMVGVELKPGTTHCVMPASSTPHLVPSFLEATLPPIVETLLALDISGNQLTTLPLALGNCLVLEELNIGSNPLRVLPPWLGNLVHLQVLIADAIGATLLPNDLARLIGLRTLSVRRNRLCALPGWLCTLTNMEWLLVDDNPFVEPWKHLINPLLNPVPATPLHTPITPYSAISAESSLTVASFSPSAVGFGNGEDGIGASGDQTITINTNPLSPLGLGMTPTSSASTMAPYHVYTPSISNFSPMGNLSPAPQSSSVTLASPSLPNTSERDSQATSSYFPAQSSRPSTIVSVAGSVSRRTLAEDEAHPLPPVPRGYEKMASTQPAPPPKVTDGNASESDKKSLKKMKSADDVRGKRSRANSVSAAMAAAAAVMTNTVKPPVPALPVPALPVPSPMHSPMPSPGPHTQSLYSTNEPSASQPRFMSLGVRGVAGQGNPHHQRPALTNSLWEPTMQPTLSEHGVFHDSPVDMGDTHGPPPAKSSQYSAPSDHEDDVLSREKTKKWGFLKKMSMSKMRGGAPESTRPSKSGKVKRPSTAQSASQTSEFKLKPGASSGRFGGAPYPQASLGPASAAPSAPHSPAAGSTLDLNQNLSPKQIDHGTPNLLVPQAARSGRRRSFLPLGAPPVLDVPVDRSPLMPSLSLNGFGGPDAQENIVFPPSDDSNRSPGFQEVSITIETDQPAAVMSVATNEAYASALRSVMGYLRDMLDLGGPVLPLNAVSFVGSITSSTANSTTSSPMGERKRRPTLVGGESQTESVFSQSFAPPRILRSMTSSASLRGGAALSMMTNDSGGSGSAAGGEERKQKDDKGKRTNLVKEIIETERTYVKLMQELVDIYITPASQSANSLTNKSETILPPQERRIVFNGLEALFTFHSKNFLPSLEKAAGSVMKASSSEIDGDLSAKVARDVAGVFVSHAAFMKMYSTYINNFDNCLQRVRQWTDPNYNPAPMGSAGPGAGHVVGLGLTMSAMGAIMPQDAPVPSAVMPLTSGQRKRIKAFMKRCRHNPRHSQLNLEGYLLLPVQRIPRYKLLLEQLVSATPPRADSYDDPIEKALEEISVLATNMNEGKRESESRRKLVQWQTRIKGKFPSPLVQPHRRLIMDGFLQLSRVVRKDSKFHQIVNADGEMVVIQVESLAPENTPRQLVAILCNDLLVLCKDPSRGRDNNGLVELWAVLRMQTLPQPASIVNGHTLRVVDHKAIMYFVMSSTSEALTWSRAINMHIPANRS